MEPNYENSTAAAKGCYWNERPFSNENERNTHNSTLPDINLLSTKNGLDFGVHLIALSCLVTSRALFDGILHGDRLALHTGWITVVEPNLAQRIFQQPLLFMTAMMIRWEVVE
jgi:hypothetical protein